MRRTRALVVIGTRPDAIKMSPVIHELRERGSRFETIVCSTGQHRELMEQALADLGYRADVDLGLMEAGQSLHDLMARIVAAVGRLIGDVAPGVVIVQGDTITTAGATLSAYYADVPVAHVEAGLRTYDNAIPFPEEGNRRLVDVLASLHFAPSELARQNLVQERIRPATIHVTGNTGIDALRWALERLPADDEPAQRRVLITAHRRENMERLPELVAAIAGVASRYTNVQFVWPAHPNPDVRRQIAPFALPANVRIADPLPYLRFVRLLLGSAIVVTDSGGLQEEASYIGKPVIVVKEKTSRVELLDSGIARLVPYRRDAIAAALDELLGQKDRTVRPVSVYGDGGAARRIVDILDRTFNKRNGGGSAIGTGT